MTLNTLYTVLWITAVYLVERPRLKKSSRIARWCSVGLLVMSGIVWEILLFTMQIPRPVHWIDGLLAPFAPVP
ncbi:MAG: hypothetical protein K0R57_2143 [Paenibacillaceae bacterium]|jgi:hypothetical protein|nr:hypothetical protein [Paenibacillaceae bacterium]